MEEFEPTASVSILAESLYRNRPSRRRRAKPVVKTDATDEKPGGALSTGRRGRTTPTAGLNYDYQAQVADAAHPDSQAKDAAAGSQELAEEQPTLLILDDCLKLTSRRNRETDRKARGKDSSRPTDSARSDSSNMIGTGRRRRPHPCSDPKGYGCGCASGDTNRSRTVAQKSPPTERSLSNSQSNSHADSTNGKLNAQSPAKSNPLPHSTSPVKNANINANANTNSAANAANLNTTDKASLASNGRKLMQHYMRPEKDTDADSLHLAKAAMESFQQETSEW